MTKKIRLTKKIDIKHRIISTWKKTEKLFLNMKREIFNS